MRAPLILDDNLLVPHAAKIRFPKNNDMKRVAGPVTYRRDLLREAATQTGLSGYS